ncbi:16S rRNA pseudouridine516 synthase [Fontibacillus phaseoli]|uniref:Pseudouridine synthase n=1 Tax=Fontibacillus phaseoli TaxID=1416533 RepID=A0A369BM51_9BACL|nr:pseudouridine synthase [Fontibacillus phaseoli]RCX21698.1 16S rRNA pseudouridine516 synthase [Fontibacillus phaseoli]
MSEGKKTQRIDKILGNLGYGSRSDIKKMVKQGRIALNGSTIKDSGVQSNPNADMIEVDGEQVFYREFVYIMLHKPPGVISATEDLRERTVIDLLPIEFRVFSPFPVGRLDKDTEGLLLLTNDGQLAHDLLSPRKHVPKTYVADCVGEIGEREASLFAQGVELDDGYVTLPARMEVLEQGTYEDGSVKTVISLTISEGKFHQVKRMLEAVGSKVTYLKRISMGPLLLDKELPMGSFRELTPPELESLRSCKNNNK